MDGIILNEVLIENRAINVNNSVNFLTVGNFTISLLFSATMQYLWSMLNSLQVMVLAILLDLMLPYNLQAILLEVKSACNFDLFQTEVIYKEFFGFADTESYSPRFEAVGLDGSNFIIHLGTLFVFISMFPIYVLFKKGGRRVC